MTTNFNNVQMFETSEDCKTFSKRFFHKNLVGGTTTIGREYKQTRRLFLSSADKPLTAVGTLTSLLCNSAKVMEKLLRHVITRRTLVRRGYLPEQGTHENMEKLLRHVITRRTLVRRGYLPEQGTHANKESLFAIVTCFMRLPRRIQRMLIVMTIPALFRETHKRRFLFNLIRRSLEKFFKKNFRDDSSFCFGFAKVLSFAFVFTLITTAESRAEDCINSSSYQVSCIEKLADANGNNSCGDNCTFKVIEENGKQVLHVYKVDISKPAEIRQGAFSPKYYADNQVKDAQNKVIPLQNIVFDNDFENIGAYAFAESGAQISSASGKFVINSPSPYFALSNNTTLNGDVYLKNLTGAAFESSRINGDVIIMEGEELNGYMFSGAYINGNLIIPESVKSILNNSSSAPGLSGLNITGQIYCASGVEACYNLAKAACGTNECLSAVDNMLASGIFRAYPDGCEKLEANLKCTKCKSASFKLEDDGWCLRKIYTPAEAAKVLRDDNTNSVTITFKK